MSVLREGNLAFNVALEGRVKLVAEILDGLFSTVDQAVGLIAGADELLLLLVVGGVGFGFLHQLFDVASERPDEAVIWMDCSLPVPRSLADTFTMPLRRC